MIGYNIKSGWGLQTIGGIALGKGIGAFGLTVQGGVKYIDFVAKNYGSNFSSEQFFRMALTGFQVSVEKSIDLIEDLAKISVSMIPSEKEVTPVLVNQKNPTELKTYEFLGPCSIVSFDLGKASIGKEIYKHKDADYLFLGQNTTIVDQSTDWLEKVAKNSDRATLGGNFLKFNEGYGPFSNARAVSRIELSDVGLYAKFENSVAIFSGQVVATNSTKTRY